MIYLDYSSMTLGECGLNENITLGSTKQYCIYNGDLD